MSITSPDAICFTHLNPCWREQVSGYLLTSPSSLENIITFYFAAPQEQFRELNPERLNVFKGKSFLQ